MGAPSYRPTIGLEIHAELSTKTKMFCDSRNDPDEAEPNTNVCPICLAHPGTLPTINKEAVRHVLNIGVALGGKIADYTEFDRKSYFYPDIPKGYQISQYEHPLVSGGSLSGVAVTRVHLEEDTARSSHHSGFLTTAAENASLVDFNRAGVPLMELVTEPVIADAKQAGDFARELQLLLRALGVSKANLEKGEMRIEANVSVSDKETLGTKVEVKNLNSFRSVERAIAYEIERQSKILSEGGEIVQETRGWDEGKQETFHQRFKEGSADYRYFPEPDLPKLVLSEIPEFSPETLRASLPELPSKMRERYASFGLKKEDVEIFVQDEFLRTLFEGTTYGAEDDIELVRLAGNYVVSDVVGLLRDSQIEGDRDHFTPSSFLALMRMLKAGEVSSRGAKDILRAMYLAGGDPREIALREGLMQIRDTNALEGIVDIVLAEHQEVADEYRRGKESALQFLVGQAMKASKGSGNPSLFHELLKNKLSK
jgi:aspartyl-tRNA(Asn)/glutamyl-tRNA(Gln) amidotransferase subunit B